jgi:hypothetical protein
VIGYLSSPAGAESAVKATLGEVAKKTATDLLGAAAATVVAEVAKTAVEAYVGPLFKALLAITDETKSNVEKLVREPLATGIREARAAMAISIRTAADLRVRDERLSNADAKLASARSMLGESTEDQRTDIYVSLMRGLIASERGAAGAAEEELRRCLTLLSDQLDLADRVFVQYQQENMNRQDFEALDPDTVKLAFCVRAVLDGHDPQEAIERISVLFKWGKGIPFSFRYPYKAPPGPRVAGKQES